MQVKILNPDNITNKYRQARKGNTELVVVEGVHAIKHAIRFGAEFVHIAMKKDSEALEVLQKFGTDTEVTFLQNNAEFVNDEIWGTLAPHPPDTGVIALAKKPENTKLESEAHKSDGFMGDTVVFIENPHSLFNVGAIIRTAVAAGVRSFAMSGRHNPWHADCISTARGLNFALEYIELITNEELLELAKQGGYTIYAMDTNTDILIQDIASDTGKKVFMFGTERDGLSKELCDAAHKVVKLPMREGVSSLNLSASVAATLYMIHL